MPRPADQHPYVMLSVHVHMVSPRYQSGDQLMESRNAALPCHSGGTEDLSIMGKLPVRSI